MKHLSKDHEDHPNQHKKSQQCHEKIDSAFHPSEVDKMSTRNFWGLSGKK